AADLIDLARVAARPGDVLGAAHELVLGEGRARRDAEVARVAALRDREIELLDARERIEAAREREVADGREGAILLERAVRRRRAEGLDVELRDEVRAGGNGVERAALGSAYDGGVTERSRRRAGHEKRRRAPVHGLYLALFRPGC